MPAVSLPPKENALFKRILVSVRLGKQWGGFSRYTGLSPLTSARRAPGHLRQEPRLRTPSQAECAPPVPSLWFPLHPARHGLPHPVSTLRRPWFRSRPRFPSF